MEDITLCNAAGFEHSFIVGGKYLVQVWRYVVVFKGGIHLQFFITADSVFYAMFL